MRKTIITVVLLVLAIAGTIYVLNKNKAKNEEETAIVAQENPAVAVRIDTAKISELDSRYVVNGTFLPAHELQISAETMGRVTRVLVEEGAMVRAGQTLAVIQGDKLNVSVSSAQAAYHTAQSDLERFESALKTGGVTQQQVEQVRLQYENAKNNLESARLNAADVSIKSSINGIVNKKLIELGSYVNMGTPAFEVVDVSYLKLRVNVDEKNVPFLNVGQKVKIHVSVYSDQDFEGEIVFIAPKADQSLNFPVDIKIANNTETSLRAGMYGTAIFGESEQVNTLIIPRDAFVGSVSAGEVFVYNEGVAKLKNVSAGRTFGDMVEVTRGLEEGEVVITSGQINLLDGKAVEIIK